MSTTRKIAFSLLLTISAVLVLAVGASASSWKYLDRVTGGELPNATNTEGHFVGTATGSLPGSWSIDVLHDVLTDKPDSPAFIDGGSFELHTILHWRPVTVDGYFPWHEGTVTQTDGFSGCGNQHYTVDGAIAGVGINGGRGTGHFSATLTHYRVWVWWVGCIVYSARVSGTVAMSF